MREFLIQYIFEIFEQYLDLDTYNILVDLKICNNLRTKLIQDIPTDTLYKFNKAYIEAIEMIQKFKKYNSSPTKIDPLFVTSLTLNELYPIKPFYKSNIISEYYGYVFDKICLQYKKCKEDFFEYISIFVNSINIYNTNLIELTYNHILENEYETTYYTEIKNIDQKIISYIEKYISNKNV